MTRTYFELDFLYQDDEEKEHWYTDVIINLPTKEEAVKYLQDKYPSVKVLKLGKLKKIEETTTEISYE